MRRGCVFVFVIFLAVSVVSALNVDNRTYVEKEYLEGEFVKGKLYVNFSDDLAGEFTSNFNGGIDLIELIELSGIGSDKYSCDPVSCQESYQVLLESAESEKDVPLYDEVNKKVYGFLIKSTNRISEITDLEFNISADMGPSCVSQVIVDLLNDGVVDFYNTGAGNNYCGLSGYGWNSGCYEEDEADDKRKLGRDLYCERIEDLPPAPAYKIRTNIVEQSGTGKINFVMYPANGGKSLAFVDVENPGIGSLEVVLNYSSLEEFDSMICMRMLTGEEKGEFWVNVENEGDELCGIYGTVGESVSWGNSDLDYDIAVRPLQYASLEGIEFDKKTFEKIKKDMFPGETIAELKAYLNDYLDEIYENDCSGQGCVIPFAIWGQDGQSVDIHDIELSYIVENSGGTETNELYELEKTPARITSEETLIFDFDKMEFEVPDESGEEIFYLCLGEDDCSKSNDIFSDVINVNIGFDFNVGPRFALIRQETQFKIVSSMQVNESEWDFGDGSEVEIVSGGSVGHSYSPEGEYFMTVSVTNNVGSISTKKFKILVGDAKSSANVTLSDYKKRIERLENGVAGLDEWVVNYVKESLDLDLLRRQINAKSEDFDRISGSATTTDDDYIKILDDLLNLNVPKNIFISSSGVLPGQVGYGSVNPAIVKEATGYSGSYDMGEAVNNIVYWMENNYDLSIDFKVVSLQNDVGQSELLKIYKVRVDQKVGADTNSAYFVIDMPLSSVEFKTLKDAESAAGGTYVAFDGSDPLSYVEFMIVGISPSVENLGLYISPSLSSFDLGGKVRAQWWENDDGSINWWRLIIGLSVLLVVFLIVYIILQTWYKNNYERKLFGNSDDLYNLINFIYNSRRNGLEASEIKEKLKAKKWDNEQISYAFKKIDGKRTGMWEIPIFKFAENKKVKEEIEKRQKAPVDTRFIKHRRFRVR